MAFACFYKMGDKKIKKINSFRNTSYENKSSKLVKPVKVSVKDALDCEKVYSKVFHCNDVARKISKICGIY